MAMKFHGGRTSSRQQGEASMAPRAGDALAIVTPGQPQAVFGARTGDIMVHDHVEGSQWSPVIAALPGGGYAVAWFQQGVGADKLYVRIFNNAGVAQTGEILVASGQGPDGNIVYTGEDMFDMRVSIAATDNGGFALAWVDHDVLLNTGGSGPVYSGSTHVYAQRFAANGSALGAVIDVAQAPVAGSPVYMNPSVGALPGGGFLVVYLDDGAADRVLTGRIYNGSGGGGTPFALTAANGNTSDIEEHAIATLADGRLVVTWAERNYQTNAQTLHVQFVTAGGPGATVSIGTPGFDSVYEPAIAALTGGNFVVTWTGRIVDQTDVYAQIFNAAGSPAGEVFRVNADVPGFQTIPNVVGMPDGGFVISYAMNDRTDPLSAGVYAQRFTATGTGLGSAFRVSEAIDGDQYQDYQEGLDVLSNGDLVFGWMTVGISGGPANDTFNSFVRIFPGDELPAGPVTGDMPVAPHAPADQYIPVIASLKGGGYAAAWFEEGNGPDKLLVRIFDNAGSPTTGVITVFAGELNFFNMDFFHMTVSISATDDGGFVLAWVDHDVVYHPNEPVIFTGETHVYSQRFSASGAAASGRVDVAVEEVGSGSPLTMNPAVSAFPGGGYLVVYVDRVGPSAELVGRIVNTAGVAGTPFVLSDSTSGPYSFGNYSTAQLAGGQLAVAWTMQHSNQSQPDQLHVRFVTSSGPGTEFLVDVSAANQVSSPGVAALAGGGFVVVWEGSAPGDFYGDVYAQLFTAAGTPSGSAFRVNAYVPYGQGEPSVVGMPDGGFVVSYESPDEIDPFSTGIFAQRFSATGAALGGAYRVNDATDDSQFQFTQEGVDLLTNGNLVFGWLTQGVDAGETYDAFTRIFSGDYLPTGPVAGTNETDLLAGTAGDDTIDGLGGNDFLFGGAGNDGLDGGNGNDIADYTGRQSDYRVTVSNGVYTITDLRAGSPDGMDTLRNVEQLRFHDGTPVAIQDTVAPDPGAGQPVGGEARGNAATTGAQSQPAVAALAGGGFVMLWEDSAQDGSGTGIFARRFGADGVAIGTTDLGIPTTTADDQRNPAVTGLADGGFLAVWENRNSGYDVLARRFAADGTPQGGAFTVNTTLAGSQTGAAVASSGSHFAIAWQSSDANGNTDIFVRLYAASGAPATGEVAVNTTMTNNQEKPAVTLLAGGGFVVTWESDGQDGSGTGIYARRFDASGAAIGTEFLVNNVTAGGQHLPAVTALAGGGFVIVWNDTGVHGRLYGANGQPAGEQFDIAANAGTAGVTALTGGGFAVSWGGSGTGLDIFARLYDSAGVAVGGAFPVNETLTGNQFNGGAGGLAQLADGTVAFGWSGNGTGDAEGVFVRRFSVGAASGPQPINGTSGPEALNGTSGDDEINGLGGADILRGLGGNDVLDGGTGDDRLEGGAGDDLYLLDSAGDVVIELPGEGNDRIVAAASYTLGANAHVERLEAAAGTAAISLIGNYLSQTLVGNAGNNVLHGAGGVDVLAGGAGDDIYYTDVAGTGVVEAAGQGSDTLYSSVSYVLGAGVSVEMLSVNSYGATTAINLTGNALNQRIVGNAGANILNGGGGADQLFGRTGDDTYIIGTAGALVVEYANEGNDTVTTSITYVLDGNASVETLQTGNAAATGAINLTGNYLGQTLIGNAGANVLHGAGGIDTLRGLGGDDIYITDVAGTLVYEGAGGGADQLYTSVSYTLLAGQEIEILSVNSHNATSAIALTGNEYGNLLHGNQGANVLDGKGGNDTLVGLGGNDRFQFTTGLGAGNVDRIIDFQSGQDRIALDDSVFSAAGSTGALSANAFVVAAAAQDASDRIVYNAATGQLFYDADGNGAGAAILFATLQGNPALVAADFIVI